MFGEDSDDDMDGVPAFLRPGNAMVGESEIIEEEGPNAADLSVDDFEFLEKYIDAAEFLLLCKQGGIFANLYSKHQHRLSDASKLSSRLLIKVFNGNHTMGIDDNQLGDFHVSKLLALFESQNPNVVDLLRDQVLSYASTRVKSFDLLVLGVIYMELFLQMNYTGPELAMSELSSISLSDDATTFAARLIECDGEYPFPQISIPHTLIIARTILGTLADPFSLHWSHGVVLDNYGNILRPCDDRMQCNMIDQCNQKLITRKFWSVRALILQLRSLQEQHYQKIPTLWKESQDMFASLNSLFQFETFAENETVTSKFALIREYVENSFDGQISIENRFVSFNTFQIDAIKKVSTQFYLEWGLSYHHFDFGDKGRDHFQTAQKVCGLETTLTAALGRRTKYQKQQIAQLYLYAKTSLICNDSSTSAQSTKVQDLSKNEPQVLDPHVVEDNTGYGEDSSLEVGRRVVRDAGDGAEAAIREIHLSQVPGILEEKILFDEGVRFEDKSLERGGRLHAVDQAVLLALCLDVNNNNPKDGLTAEEMFPYLERVIQNPENWMVHSTALLERSWLEYEKRRTFDRALLQIQALLDQHSTRLTITQSTFESVQQSSPLQDRVQHIHCLIYPSQFELKRDLAMRYMRGNVFVSALNLYKELELWDEVVQCYQFLDKPQRAEMLVRERLKTGPTPYMYTALGDLTSDLKCYELAWQLSEGRFARAKRTLARILYDAGNYESALTHLIDALAVQPLVATAWYLRGLCCMQLQKWEEGIEAFIRCIQQDDEIGEALANIAAIRMKQRKFDSAYIVLIEALKKKPDSWKIMENLMSVTLALKKYSRTVYYMDMLLERKHKSNRPYHVEEMRFLVKVAIHNFQRSLLAQRGVACAKDDENANNTEHQEEEEVQISSESEIECQMLFEFAQNKVSIQGSVDEAKQMNNTDNIAANNDLQSDLTLIRAMEAFFLKLSNSVKSETEIWDIIAEFYVGLNQRRNVIECRMKQLRASILEIDWEKTLESISRIVAVIDQVVEAHRQPVATKSDLYACVSILQTTLKKILVIFTRDSHECIQRLQTMLTEMEEKYQSMSNVN